MTVFVVVLFLMTMMNSVVEAAVFDNKRRLLDTDNNINIAFAFDTENNRCWLHKYTGGTSPSRFQASHWHVELAGELVGAGDDGTTCSFQARSMLFLYQNGNLFNGWATYLSSGDKWIVYEDCPLPVTSTCANPDGSIYITPNNYQFPDVNPIFDATAIVGKKLAHTGFAPSPSMFSATGYFGSAFSSTVSNTREMAWDFTFPHYCIHAYFQGGSGAPLAENIVASWRCIPRATIGTWHIIVDCTILAPVATYYDNVVCEVRKLAYFEPQLSTIWCSGNVFDITSGTAAATFRSGSVYLTDENAMQAATPSPPSTLSEFDSLCPEFFTPSPTPGPAPSPTPAPTPVVLKTPSPTPLPVVHILSPTAAKKVGTQKPAVLKPPPPKLAPTKKGSSTKRPRRLQIIQTIPVALVPITESPITTPSDNEDGVGDIPTFEYAGLPLVYTALLFQWQAPTATTALPDPGIVKMYNLTVANDTFFTQVSIRAAHATAALNATISLQRLLNYSHALKNASLVPIWDDDDDDDDDDTQLLMFQQQEQEICVNGMYTRLPLQIDEHVQQQCPGLLQQQQLIFRLFQHEEEGEDLLDTNDLVPVVLYWRVELLDSDDRIVGLSPIAYFAIDVDSLPLTTTMTVTLTTTLPPPVTATSGDKTDVAMLVTIIVVATLGGVALIILCSYILLSDQPDKIAAAAAIGHRQKRDRYRRQQQQRKGSEHDRLLA